MKNNRIIGIASAFILIALLTLAYYLSEIFLPLLVAVILAYLLEPLVTPLEKRGVNRSLAIFIVFAGFLTVFVLTGVFLVSTLRMELSNVQINLPVYAARLYDIIPLQLKTFFDIETPDKAYLQLNKSLDELRGISFDILRETFALVKKAFSSTLAFLLAILGYLITPVYLYYFLKDLPNFKKGFLELFPERFQSVLDDRLAEIDALLTGFIRGQLTVCALLAVLYSVGLYFINIDLAIAVGTLAGATFIIPYFGTLLGIILSVILAFLKFHDLIHPLLCVAWFTVVQTLEGAVITPRIVGDTVGLHPIVIIVALLIGGQLFGLLGMILAVPATAVLKVVWCDVLARYRTSSYFTGE